MKKLCIAIVLILPIIPAVLLIQDRGEEGLLAVSTDYKNVFPYHVILDAGHGGEDGGAVAPDGTLEKDLNLQISNDIAALFDLCGIRYTAVRKTDIAVGDLSLSTIRARKTSDILTRFALINETPHSMLLSIHQNIFEQAKYYGTQVFYSPNDENSEIIARSIQKTVIQNLQPENSREVKPSGNSIYLLFRAKRPSVLVECGFLSNPDELNKLKTSEYQTKISFFILKGLIQSSSQLQ